MGMDGLCPLLDINTFCLSNATLSGRGASNASTRSAAA
jgi:hypothetical protein